MNSAEAFQQWIGQVVWSMLREYWYAFAVLTIGAIYLFYARRDGDGGGGGDSGGADLTLGDDGSDGGADGGGDGGGGD